MSPDDVDTFVSELTDFLNKMLPPTKYMGDFFDTNDNYIPVLEFVHDQLDVFLTKDRNYN